MSFLTAKLQVNRKVFCRLLYSLLENPSMQILGNGPDSQRLKLVVVKRIQHVLSKGSINHTLHRLLCKMVCVFFSFLFFSGLRLKWSNQKLNRSLKLFYLSALYNFSFLLMLTLTWEIFPLYPHTISTHLTRDASI